MHALIIPTWYPSGEDKLMGVYHKQLAAALAKHTPCKVHILFIERRRLRNPLAFLMMKKRVIEHNEGFDTVIFRMLNLAPIHFGWQQKRYCRKLNRALKWYEKHYGKPDLLHAQVILPAGYAAVDAGKKHQIPVLVTEHCGSFKEFFDAPLTPYSKPVLADAAFSAVSRFMVDFVQEKTGVQGDTLPNLVNCALFDRPHLQSKDGICRLTCVCALREGKGLPEAFEAVKLLHQTSRIPHIQLTVVGDGYLKTEYENIAKETGVWNLVNFAGRKSHEEIAQILQQTDILIIPSHLESFAIPGIEALAAGVPVVSTRCHGPEEFVNDQTGALCEVKDATSLADAIEQVWNHRDAYPAERLKQAAAYYDENQVAQRAVNLYEKTIQAYKA